MLYKCQILNSDSSKRINLIILLLAFIWPSYSSAQALNIDQMNKKIHLVEFVLSDIKKKSANLFESNQMFKDGYQYAVKELEKAKVAIAQKRYEQASKSLEQAFINMSYARTFLAKPSVDKEQEQLGYNKLTDAVIEFLQSLEESLTKTDDKIGSSQLLKAKQLKESAQQLHLNNDLKTAKSKMEESYQVLVSALTRIKDKQTVTISLNFETPKDEYLYEIRRLESFQMLLKLRQENFPLAKGSDKLINSLIDKSALEEANAGKAANNQDYSHAIELLESANENLKRALRMTGLTMF